MIKLYKNNLKYDLLLFDIMKLKNINSLRVRYQSEADVMNKDPTSTVLLLIQYAYHSLVTKKTQVSDKPEQILLNT